VFALLGRKDEALAILDEMLELAAKRYVAPFDLALLHFAVDNPDEGFHWLTKAFDDRGIEIMSLRVDPRFEPVRSDPRFVALVERLKMPA
jgi:serine/threonine-protein kinase